MKTVSKAFAIYRVESFQAKTPMGVREVRKFSRESEVVHELPEEVVEQLNKISAFNQESLFEGTGQVLAQTQQGVFPHPVNFIFADDVKSVQEAFDRFDEHMEREVQKLQEAQAAQSPGIQRAGADTLRKLDAAARKSPGGILMP